MPIKKYLKIIAVITPILILGIIVVISLLAPYFEYQRVEFSQNLYSVTHFICHQIPTRCLWIKTSNMGLCASCFAIYTSLFITGIFYLIKRSSNINLLRAFLLVVPCLIEGLVQAKTAYTSNNVLRLVLGTMAGIGIGSILFPYYYKFLDI